VDPPILTIHKNLLISANNEITENKNTGKREKLGSKWKIYDMYGTYAVDQG
jgi:hypothetical protein